MGNYFQILACNEVVGTCCSDYGLVSILDILRQVLRIIQMVVPILLMVGLTIQFTQLMITPEDKKKIKSLQNKFTAALLCFLLPIIMDLILGLIPNSFQISACWDIAKISREVLKAESTYQPVNNKTRKSIFSNYNFSSGSSNNSGVTKGTATGKAVVQYAKSFIGKPYVLGGYWNGERPYTPTDCSGFVQGVFKHFGINLPRTTDQQWAATNTYTKIKESELQAGDLIMYNGHVAIATGNGTEIVHAATPKGGVKTSPTYKFGTIWGYMRIKGIN